MADKMTSGNGGSLRKVPFKPGDMVIVSGWGFHQEDQVGTFLEYDEDNEDLCPGEDPIVRVQVNGSIVSVAESAVVLFPSEPPPGLFEDPPVTAPERPSNKPPPGSYDDRADTEQAYGFTYTGGPTLKGQSQQVKLEVADVVNHPPHYTQGGIECIDAIKAALTEDEFRGYCKGNALKYVWRERHKGGVESLEKAMWYLKRLVAR